MGFCPMHDFCWNLPSLCFICAIKHSIVCGALMPRTGSIWLGYTNWKASGINPKYLALNRTIDNRQIHRPSADGSVYIWPMDRHRPMGKKFTIVWTLARGPFSVWRHYLTDFSGSFWAVLFPFVRSALWRKYPNHIGSIFLSNKNYPVSLIWGV